MPELPEVEYTRQNLERWALGATIVAVTTDDARITRPLRPRTMVRGLVGRRIERIARRGKWLRFELEDGHHLYIHLGMTGWFERADPAASPARFERARFVVARRRGRAEERTALVYVDSRRWGRLVLRRDELPTWTKLGPDPLADGIDLAALEATLARRGRSSIKEALMDQSVLAGVGNIQAIEALWRARVDPRARAAAIGASELRAIARGIRWTVARTLADLEANGFEGPSPFVIYGKKGTPCPRCGAILEHATLGGRTTTFCPGCQLAPIAPAVSSSRSTRASRRAR